MKATFDAHLYDEESLHSQEKQVHGITPIRENNQAQLFGSNEYNDGCHAQIGRTASGGPEGAPDQVDYHNHQPGQLTGSDLRRKHGYAEAHKHVFWCLGGYSGEKNQASGNSRTMTEDAILFSQLLNDRISSDDRASPTWSHYPVAKDDTPETGDNNGSIRTHPVFCPPCNANNKGCRDDSALRTILRSPRHGSCRGVSTRDDSDNQIFSKEFFCLAGTTPGQEMR